MSIDSHEQSELNSLLEDLKKADMFPYIEESFKLFYQAYIPAFLRTHPEFSVSQFRRLLETTPMKVASKETDKILNSCQGYFMPQWTKDENNNMNFNGNIVVDKECNRLRAYEVSGHEVDHGITQVSRIITRTYTVSYDICGLARRIIGKDGRILDSSGFGLDEPANEYMNLLVFEDNGLKDFLQTDVPGFDKDRYEYGLAGAYTEPYKVFRLLDYVTDGYALECKKKSQPFELEERCDQIGGEGTYVNLEKSLDSYVATYRNLVEKNKAAGMEDPYQGLDTNPELNNFITRAAAVVNHIFYSKEKEFFMDLLDSAGNPKSSVDNLLKKLSSKKFKDLTNVLKAFKVPKASNDWRNVIFNIERRFIDIRLGKDYSDIEKKEHTAVLDLLEFEYSRGREISAEEVTFQSIPELRSEHNSILAVRRNNMFSLVSADTADTGIFDGTIPTEDLNKKQELTSREGLIQKRVIEQIGNTTKGKSSINQNVDSAEEKDYAGDPLEVLLPMYPKDYVFVNDSANQETKAYRICEENNHLELVEIELSPEEKVGKNSRNKSRAFSGNTKSPDSEPEKGATNNIKGNGTQLTGMAR